MRRIVNRVARRLQVREQCDDAFGHIEADRITSAPGRAGVVRHENGNAPVHAFGSLQTHQGGDPVGHHRDPVGLRLVGERGEGEPVVGRQRMLEGDRTGEHAAIEFRQHHVHGQIGGTEPARALAPGTAFGVGDHDLEHRHPGTVEGRRLCRVAGRERRGGDDHRRIEPREGAAQELGRGFVLEARYHERGRRQPAGRQGRAQGIDRREVRREQQRAIKHDRHDRPRRRQRRDEAIEIDRPDGRQITGGARHRPGLMHLKLGARVARETPQQRAQILGPTLAEEGEQTIQLRGGQIREIRESGVVAVLPRQQRQGDAVLARDRREPVDAVAPEVEPAEEAHQDHLGVPTYAIDPEIDRERVAQVRELREAHARQRVFLHRPGGGEPGKVALGERQHCDLAGRLAQVDGFDDFVEGRGCGREQVHDAALLLHPCPLSGEGQTHAPTSACAMAARSRPLSPITTSRPWRGSSDCQRRSYW